MSTAILLMLLFNAGQDPQQIVLKPDMLINESAFGNAKSLVDEQASTVEAPPSKPFFAGWTDWRYPLHLVIDLKGLCQVDELRLYNESGEADLTVSTGRPFEWSPVKFKSAGYKAWNALKLNKSTRWLRLTLAKPASIPEIFVYGKRSGPLEAEKSEGKPLRKLSTMDELVGVNAFIDDPIDKISGPSGMIREYHPWGWDVEAPDGKVRFQPSGAAGGKSWFFDDYYKKLKEAGLLIAPVVWQSPTPLFATKSKEHKPLLPNVNTEDPAAYKVHAQHLYQYAARYGSRKAPDAMLKLAPDQPRRTGLGLISYLENWNEPDKDWEGREGRFNPFDLAAMSSADYDGHKGTMGPGVGVKAADPSMKLVLGGLAGLSLDYLEAIHYWSQYKRGGSFPADVINLHHYCSTSNGQAFQTGGKGVSPEEDKLEERLMVFTKWRDKVLPNTELWLTEFGWDTNPASPLHAPAVGSMTAEDVQSAWLIRAHMAIAAARFDRATMFMLRDVNSKGTGVFETCGLVTEKGQWNPKPSWHSQAMLKKTLKGYRFSKKVALPDKNLRLYEFTDSRGRKAYAAWCATSTDMTVKGVKLPIAGTKAKVVSLESMSMGREGQKAISSKTLVVDLNETPKLILVD